MRYCIGEATSLDMTRIARLMPFLRCVCRSSTGEIGQWSCRLSARVRKLRTRSQGAHGSSFAVESPRVALPLKVRGYKQSRRYGSVNGERYVSGATRVARAVG